MRPLLRFACAVALVALSLGAAAPAAQQKDGPPITLSTTIVVVDAAVVDKRTGRPVGGLERDDFEIYENGARRKVEFFAHEELPLSVVFLFDVSLYAVFYQEQLREASLKALARLRPDDEVAVLAYGIDAEVLRGFSKDHKATADAIANLGSLANVGTISTPRGEIGFMPGTVLNKGLRLAAQYTANNASKQTRRAIVVVSPENKPIQVPIKNASKKEVLRELAESNAVVCGLILDGSFLESANVGGAFKLLAVRTGISTYAEETGGTVVKTGASALGSSLAGVLDELRVRYTFGYAYVSPKKLGEYRKIKVKLAPAAERRLGKVAVLARKGYHATTK